MRKWLPEELEEIPCDFCGSREVAREFIRADGMRVVECAICGLAYLNPRPRAELIPEFYKKDYFTGASAERGEGGLKLNLDVSDSASDQNQKSIPRPIAIINEKFGGFKGKRVLEIGCATGDLLHRIQIEGASVKGLEISDFAADVARRRGLDVTTGTVEEFAPKNKEKFDIVLALEVIEHVLSPTSFFEHASRLLKPGGLLLISTPNYACVKRFRDSWIGFNMSFEHIYFYSFDALKKMMAKEGLVNSYMETSKYLGAGRKGGIIERQTERVRTIAFFTGEIGLLRTLAALFMRHKGRYPYTLGHTLFGAFVKKV